MKRSIRSWLLVGALAAPGVAFSQGDVVPGSENKAAPAAQEIPPEAAQATELLTKYLDAVKGKKWAAAKKLTHPRTVKAIAERKKRLGDENHPMAPWYFAKGEYWLKNYKIVSARQAPLDTWVVETSEDNFQVEEKGLSEGDMATYLVGKVDGRWMVVDKKRGVTFTDDSVKLGYKAYFDTAPKPVAAEEE